MSDFSRRGFIAGIIAAGLAPAVVKAGIIMPIKPALVAATSLDQVTLGRAQIRSTGPAWVMIRGRNALGQPVKTMMKMTEGLGFTKEEFWKIDRVTVESWDDAVVVVRDGLGNDVTAAADMKRYMRRYGDTDEVRAIIAETAWVDPKESGPQIMALDPRRVRVT